MTTLDGSNKDNENKSNYKTSIPPKPPVPQIATNDIIDDNIFNATDIDFDAKLPAPLDMPKPTTRIVEIENEVFRAVEEMPIIVGGLASIIKNIHYTESGETTGY